MLNFFLIPLLFFLIEISSCFAQDFQNSLSKKNNIYSNYYDNYQDDIENYQLNYANPTTPNNFQPLTNKSIEVKNQRDYITNNYNYAPSPIAEKKYKNFNDGKGVGYRVYDNSNRQSYFCNIAPNPKKNFSHDNNFNGVYLGIGFAKIDSSVNFSQTTSSNTNKNINSSYNFNYSGSKALPSILIGQGRLFSSGLFLGQEYAINIGEFNVESKKIDNNEYSKINFSFSNYSYYSGKFGFNIFKIFLPYAKISFSTSSSRYILESKKNSTRTVHSGSFPTLGFGVGVDISIQDHLRAIIDYTQFSTSGDGEINNYENILMMKNTLSFDSSFSFSRASLIYKF
jgi:hypothetical protein